MPQQCRHIFLDGHRCGSPTLRTRDFCYHHHLTRRPVHTSSCPTLTTAPSSLGWDSSNQLLQSIDLPTPDCRAAVQFSIGEVLRHIALNQLDPRRAGLLLYGLSLAAQTLPRESKDGSCPTLGQSSCPTLGRASSALGWVPASTTPVEETILHSDHGLIAPEADLLDPEAEPDLETLLMEDWLREPGQPENPKLAKLLGNSPNPPQQPTEAPMEREAPEPTLSEADSALQSQPQESEPASETTINLQATADPRLPHHGSDQRATDPHSPLPHPHKPHRINILPLTPTESRC